MRPTTEIPQTDTPEPTAMKTETQTVTTTETAPHTSSGSRGGQVWKSLSFQNIGAVYVLIAIIVISSIVLPNTFPTIETVRQIFNSNAVTALSALALLVPLCAGVFDLSFAYTMSLAGVTAAHLVVSSNVPVVLALVVSVLVGLGVGAINGVIVVTMKIDSFIGTLATGSLIQAFITFVTKDNSITSVKLLGSFSKIGQYDVDGFTAPVIYVIVLAIVLWRLLEHHRTGRRLYAIGFNADAARLAGIRNDRLRFGALVLTGGIAGFAGVVLASTLGSGSPTAGTSYLLPAYAATFLGATQFRNGRFNAAGTLVAVLLLGTGITTLGLANAPNWTPNMFTGVVLIVSLAAAGAKRRGTVTGHPLLARLRRRADTDVESPEPRPPVLTGTDPPA